MKRTATSDVVHRRLHAQGLVGAGFAAPADVVTAFGAVQAQDYAGSLWGIGLRTRSATEEDVEAAIASRAIVRSWPMRGTLHFVPAADLRWMLALLAPRVLARAKRRYADLGLDEKAFVKSEPVLERALSGRELTRDELYQALERAKISTAGQRGIHILGNLAMKGVICFGARRGKQPTLALLEEWIPPAPAPGRDESLARLARAYFTGHGPATLDDFAWWAGLPRGDAEAGLALVRRELVKDVIEERSYWRAPGDPPKQPVTSVGHLLPAWDEYAVAYKDRSAILDPAHAARSKNGIFSPIVTLGGCVVGTWRRETKKDRVRIDADLFGAPRATRALCAAVERYGRFVSREPSLEVRQSID